jgi:hypothetical protein
MEVIGSIFNGRNQEGDFAWMITRPEYADALFVFNDNEEQWAAHRRNEPAGFVAGGGNAVIRPYQRDGRAIGIPTGAHGNGYRLLTDHVRSVIDMAIAGIGELLTSGRYKRVIYSAANESGELGTGIFQVADDIKRYIVKKLNELRG